MYCMKIITVLLLCINSMCHACVDQDMYFDSSRLLDSIPSLIFNEHAKIHFTYRGPLASTLTPFNNNINKSLNLPIISTYAEFLSSKNITGVLEVCYVKVTGTLGEGVSMSIEERRKVVEAWASAVKNTKQHLMVHVGGATPENIKKLAAHAESIGAGSLLVSPNICSKYALKTEDVIRLLQLVSLSAPKTPLFYYHNPIFKTNIDIDEFLTRVANRVPTFVGMKHVTNNLTELMNSRKFRNNYTIFVGEDAATLPGCVLEMDSMITSTLTFFPEPTFEILKFCRNRREFERAEEAQKLINNIIKELLNYGHDTVTTKAATSMTTHLPLGPPRAPLEILSQETLESMAKGLSKLGLKVHDDIVQNMY